MSFDTVQYSVERGVGRITLNRPDRLNASNGALSRDLSAAFNAAAADPMVRVTLLSGAGRGFCAGADQQVLNEHSASADSARSGSNGLRYDGIMCLQKPVIAAVHGACAGIGLALACAADIRLASVNAFFVAPFAQLGLCAEGGLAWLLTRLMGKGNAAELLLSARRMYADEAFAKGLVAQVLPNEGFAEAAFEYAVSMAGSGAPNSFAIIKRQLAEADSLDFENARRRAETLTRATLQTPEFREAMLARREGRNAIFSGITASFSPPITQN